jgi:hypothetical protein
MRRLYVDTSDFRAPFDSPQLDLAGPRDEFPTARRYYDVSDFRAPYDRGYFQDNTLFGVGSAPILEQAQEVLCPVKDPIRNPYTVSALLLGVILGGGAGWLAARIFR